MQLPDALILLLNLLATYALTGIIWIIQLLHYPYLRFTDPVRFREGHNFHIKAITPVVAPLMIAELIGAVLLVIFGSGVVARWLSAPALGLVAIVWLSTFFVQVPLHNTLAKGPDEAVIRRLAATNWLRTACWTARSAILTYVMIGLLLNRL